MITLNYDENRRVLLLSMKLEDVKKDQTQIVHQDTRPIPENILYLPDYINSKLMEDWVLEFINKSNPARSEILATEDQSINMIIDGDIERQAKLPYYRSFLPGTYNLTFIQRGYEQKDTTVIAVLGEPIKAEISLKKKSPYKAFLLSTIPGQGQRYSSDLTSLERRKTGLYFTIGGALALVTTGYVWNQYNQSIENYNSNKSLYMNQNEMNSIGLHRANTSSAHQKMNDHYQIAITISSATLGFWIYNMIEAAVNLIE